VFERFTERARQVVVLAQDEARGVKHSYIGTEHVLLGLARENEGVASRILLDLGADAGRIRNEIVRMLGGRSYEVRAVPVPVRGRVPTSLSAARLLIGAWLLGAVTVGAGVLVGWAIWGH
jgi:ATP-dependent Clp protease ATP-binding subunit ClpC